MDLSDFKKQMLDALGQIKGSRSFVYADTRPFQFPGMNIDGIGEIGFPINPLEVKEIIKVAHKASFGKGSETVMDTNVRSVWEINADKISFSNNDWSRFVNSIIEQIKPQLGIQEHNVTANLYKLLIYEKGDFFLAHKDSEKEKGMFGSLVIGLPAKHTGGELAIRFEDRTEVIDFSTPSSQYKIPFAAFYADCEHEILPITSGYRVCLTYNLIQQNGNEKIQMHKLEDDASRLAKTLKAAEDDENTVKIILLGHQYTPSNYTMDALKLNDRPKVEALTMAAEKAGYFAKLGLVTSYQIGELIIESQGRSRRGRYHGYDDYYDDDDVENGEMGEVFDEDTRVEHWMHDGLPPLRNIHVEVGNIVSDKDLHGGDPIEKEAEGYTGNAGMEMTYWYHYGAVFLWPKKHQYELLSKLDASNKLEWIGYYNSHWDSITAQEISMVMAIVRE